MQDPYPLYERMRATRARSHRIANSDFYAVCPVGTLSMGHQCPETLNRPVSQETLPSLRPQRRLVVT